MFKVIFVENLKNSKAPFEVKIQSDKNGGICDIVLPKEQVEPVKPTDTSKGAAVRAYNAAKKEYDSYMRGRSALRSEALNVYQGRPLKGVYVTETICTFLTALLNR